MNFIQHRLFFRSASAQLVKAYSRFREQHFTSYQPSGPVAINRKRATQHSYHPLLIGSSDIHHSSCGIISGMNLEIQLPLLRKKTTLGSAILSLSGSLAIGLNIASRSALKAAQRFMGKACPHFGLPLSVITFDSSLEAFFSRRNKYRRHPQRQTQAHHLANGVAALMRSLKKCIIIKLGAARQAPALPMTAKRLNNIGGFDAGGLRPGACQSTMQRDNIQDFYQRAVFNLQAFNQVKFIQFTALLGYLRQIPSFGRRFAALGSVMIQLPPALKNPVDGANAGYLFKTLLQQPSSDGFRSIFPQITMHTKMMTRFDDHRLHSAISTIGLAMGGARPSSPINTIQFLTFCTFYPKLYRTQTAMDTTSHRTHLFSTANRCYHGPSLITFRSSFLFIINTS